ncbi:MAG TPA: hypothetical protein VLY04_16390 [Bryobacteraceae bacterium]|nr:hypothetical protein [Bryobacteraceae bacterium]
MACDDLPDDLKTLWKEAGSDRPMFSPDQLRNETQKLEAKRRRAYRVLAVAFTVVVVSLAVVTCIRLYSPLTRIGAILGVFSWGYALVYVLAERARSIQAPPEIDGVRHYRAELERMRDWHRGFGSWRFPILVPPFILCDLGLARTFAHLAPWTILFVWFDCTIFLGLVAIWGPIKHRRLARKYQERIDALDGASAGTSPGAAD